MAHKLPTLNSLPSALKLKIKIAQVLIQQKLEDQDILDDNRLYNINLTYYDLLENLTAEIYLAIEGKTIDALDNDQFDVYHHNIILNIK